MARPALWVDVVVKALLVGLLAFAVARPDLQQFAGKAMTGRAIAYPIAALTKAPNPDAAAAFVAYVLSPDGQAVLEAGGFAAP